MVCFKEKVSLVFLNNTLMTVRWSAMDSQRINLDQPDVFKDHYKTHKQMNASSQSTTKESPM
jgi:hypothetical protein